MVMLDPVKQKQTTTDRQGSFEFTGVMPGRYELQIKKSSSHGPLHSKFAASSVLPDPL